VPAVAVKLLAQAYSFFVECKKILDCLLDIVNERIMSKIIQIQLVTIG